MTTFAYKKIDAFTSALSSGNPAACLYLEAGQSLPEEAMLEIAKAHKGFVSEVVYCQPLGEAYYGLRYYSSECEVAFCGHGTIACMYALIKSDSALMEIPEVRIHTVKGELNVYNDIHALDSVFITAPDSVEHPVHAAPQEIARALGLETEKIDASLTIECIDAGLRTLIVPIADLDAVLAMHPDEPALKEFCLKNDIDIVLIFTNDVIHKENKVRTRVFAPRFGYLEDAATGSGNAALGYYMRKNGMWDGKAVSIEQNGERTAYNVIKLREKDGRVLFGGKAATRIEGRYIL